MTNRHTWIIDIDEATLTNPIGGVSRPHWRPTTLEFLDWIGNEMRRYYEQSQLIPSTQISKIPGADAWAEKASKELLSERDKRDGEILTRTVQEIVAGQRHCFMCHSLTPVDGVHWLETRDSPTRYFCGVGCHENYCNGADLV